MDKLSFVCQRKMSLQNERTTSREAVTPTSHQPKLASSMVSSEGRLSEFLNTEHLDDLIQKRIKCILSHSVWYSVICYSLLMGHWYLAATSKTTSSSPLNPKPSNYLNSYLPFLSNSDTLTHAYITTPALFLLFSKDPSIINFTFLSFASAIIFVSYFFIKIKKTVRGSRVRSKSFWRKTKHRAKATAGNLVRGHWQ